MGMFSALRPSGLSRRIVAWSFVPTALILLAAALIIFLAYERVTQQLLVERGAELARLSAGRLATELEEFPGALDSLARTSAVNQGTNAVRREALRGAANRLAVFDGGVVMLDEHGVVVASQPERPTDMGTDWADRPWFRAIVNRAGPAFSDVTADGPGGARVVVVGVPVTGENGEFRGVLAGMFRLGATSVSAFYGDIVKLRLDESGRSFVVDARGRAIHYPDSSRVGADLSAEAPVARFLAGDEGALRAKGADGVDVVMGYAPIPGTGWGMISVETWSYLSAPSRGFRRTLLLLLILGVIVPTAVVTVGVRRITRDAYAQLEQTVAARTRELAVLNRVAAVASGSLKIERILQDSLDQTVEATGMDYGVAFRIDEDSPALEMVAQHALSTRLAAVLSRLPVSSTIGLWAGDALEPRVWSIDALPAGDLRDGLAEAGLSCVVGIPLVAKDRTVGLLALGSREECVFSVEDLALLKGVGRQVGMAVDNARLYEESERSATAAERSRLARDLHDAVSQTLFSAALIAEVLPRIWERDPEEGRRRLEELRGLTRGALAEMRTLLLELRPASLVEADLGDLMRQLAEAFAGRARVPVDLDVEGVCCLPADVQVAFYRVAQEALNNVTKHAEAEHVRLMLRAAEREASLEVSDDGRGFTGDGASSEHLGLGIMEERADAVGAQLTVESRPGEGTRVALHWEESPPPAPAAGESDGGVRNEEAV
jgi:signal transduction histidine kinase